jgi:hypothetical protein
MRILFAGRVSFCGLQEWWGLMPCDLLCKIPITGRKHPSEFRLQRVLEALQAENTPGFGRTLWDTHIVFRPIKILLAPSKATGGCAEFA